MRAAIIAATAATLRQVAGWGCEIPGDELIAVADLVLALSHDEICCPVCEETECDEDCALAPVRSVLPAGMDAPIPGPAPRKIDINQDEGSPT
jgi:hypothetical protein